MKISNNKFEVDDSGAMFLTEQEATPPTPATGKFGLFVKTDRSLYTLDSEGVEQPVGGAAGTGDMLQEVYDFDGDGVVDNSAALNGNPDTYFASDASAVHNIGDETIDGVKTFTSNPILPAGTPTDPQAAVTLAYAQAIAAGLLPKDPVRAATTGNITLSGTQTVDGVSLNADDSVLVKNQSTSSQNGIYLCKADAWVRRTDYDETAEVRTGSFTYVLEGTTNISRQFALSTTGTIEIGVTGLSFAQISAGGGYQGSSSIDITGTTISVKAGGVTSAMLAGSITDSKLSQITTASKVSGAALTSLGSIPSGAGTIPIARLGTGTPSASNFLRGDGTFQAVTAGTTVESGYAVITRDIVNPISAATWTNMPAVVAPFISTSNAYKFREDTTYYTDYKITCYMSVAGATNADLNLQYSTNNSTWYACDTGGAGECAVGGTSGAFKSGNWTPLVAGAKGEGLYFRIVGKDGDGVVDPAFYRLAVHFRMPVLSTEINETISDVDTASFNMTTTTGADVDGTGAQYVTVNSFSGGLTNFNANFGYGVQLIGGAQDNNAIHIGFMADDANKNGGTSYMVGCYVGTGHDNAMILYSGNIQYFDYDFSLKGERETNGNGNNLTIEAASGHDSGATDRNGGIVNIYGGEKVNAGNDGYVKIGRGSITPSLTLDDDDMVVVGNVEIGGDIRFNLANAETRIDTATSAGVARYVTFDIPITTGGNPDTPLGWQFALDGIVLAGLVADTDGSGSYKDAVWKVPYYAGDYGADWASFTPPAPTAFGNGDMFTAYNSNVGVTESRAFFYINGGWKYAMLTTF